MREHVNLVYMLTVDDSDGLEDKLYFNGQPYPQTWLVWISYVWVFNIKFLQLGKTEMQRKGWTAICAAFKTKIYIEKDISLKIWRSRSYWLQFIFIR